MKYSRIVTSDPPCGSISEIGKLCALYSLNVGGSDGGSCEGGVMESNP